MSAESDKNKLQSARPALNSMMTRRSVPPRHLRAPGPTAVDLRVITAAAATAPDHRGLRPFRFIEIADRDALAEAFVGAERELNPAAGEEEFLRARERAGHAPCLVALITRLDAAHAEVTVPEQLASAGAALGYFILAAHDLGFGAMAVSGDKARSRTLHSALRLAENEALLCFIAIGTPAKIRGPRDPADSGILTRWRSRQD